MPEKPGDTWDRLIGKQTPAEFMHFCWTSDVDVAVADYLDWLGDPNGSTPEGAWLDEEEYEAVRRNLVAYINEAISEKRREA